MYQEWYFKLIDPLPKHFKTLRHKKKPEWIRRLEFILETRRVLDILTCILSVVLIFFWLIYISYDKEKIIFPLNNVTYYNDIYNLSYIKKIYTWIAAIITFVLALRFLKQLESSRSMKLLQEVLAVGFKDT